MIKNSVTLKQIQDTKPFVDAIIVNKEIFTPNGRYEGTAGLKNYKFNGKNWEDSNTGKKFTDSQVKDEINGLLKNKNAYMYFHAKQGLKGKKTTPKQYHELSEATLDKVVKLAKTNIETDLSRHRGSNWEGVNIDADLVYPMLENAFEKVTGESNPDVLEKWVGKFLDEDIYRSQDLFDSVEEMCNEYHITTDGTNETFYGKKTTKPRRKTTKKSCVPKLNVRGMF